MKSGYCTIMWDGIKCGASEMNHCQPHHRPKVNDVYMVGLEESLLLWTLSIKPINCKYCSQLDTLKVAFDEKHSELIIIKCIISHQFNAMTRQKWLQFGWEVLIHPSYSPTLQLQMPVYFGLYNILLMEKKLHSLSQFSSVSQSCLTLC